MNRDKLILLLAALATLLLGPGVGHLIIKQWRKAIILMAVAFIWFIVLAYFVVSQVGHETMQAVADFGSVDKFVEIYEKFKDDNASIMLVFNAVLAGLWAYSIVDLFLIFRKNGSFTK